LGEYKNKMFNFLIFMIMDNLVPICIVGFVVLGIYRLFELFARRKERLAIIEKLEHIKSLDTKVDLNLSLFQKPENFSWALRVSLLLMGVGIGLVVAYFIEMASINHMMEYYKNWNFRNKIEVVYFASVAIFGGIGLLAAYFIEQKQKQKEKE
jgi:hypothetical protein